jgi:hypothetical protein
MPSFLVISIIVNQVAKRPFLVRLHKAKVGLIARPARFASGRDAGLACVSCFVSLALLALELMGGAVGPTGGDGSLCVRIASNRKLWSCFEPTMLKILSMIAPRIRKCCF